LRLLLEELCAEYQTEAALLAYRDADLERIFIWRMRSGEANVWSGKSTVDARGRVSAGRYGSVAGLEFAGRPRRRVRLGPPKQAGPENPAAHSGPTQLELGIKNFISVAFDQEGHAAGRLFLINRRPGQEPFIANHWSGSSASRPTSALHWRIFSCCGTCGPGDRGGALAISRDLHDGILQTLLSIEIQIDVLRRKVSTHLEQVEPGWRPCNRPCGTKVRSCATW